MVLEEGLKMDPFNPYIKLQLEAATQGSLADLLEGQKYTASSPLNRFIIYMS